MAEYLLGIDQGSSQSKAILMDSKGHVVAGTAATLRSFAPGTGWLEQDPDEIIGSQVTAIEKLCRTNGKKMNRIIGIGIANQRSTFLIWDRQSGRPLTTALSWQDLRGQMLLGQWEEHRSLIRKKTGLMLNPYYSASKINWLLKHNRGLRSRLEKGSALFGTVNTWLIWKLTRGEVYATDPTNAARTLLMDLKSRNWDTELLNLFHIPARHLPVILPTAAHYGTARILGREVSIFGSIGDQQAGMLGAGVTQNGNAVVNYGTGGFLLLNTGSKMVRIRSLLTSIAWSTRHTENYQVEGTVNTVGAIFDWLNAIGVIDSLNDIDPIVKRKMAAVDGVIVVPSFTGLGTPHWLPGIQTAIFGISASTGKDGLILGALRGISLLVRDIVDTLKKDPRTRIRSITASGGGSRYRSLIQTPSDLLAIPVHLSKEAQATARGAAILAGVGSGLWSSPHRAPHPGADLTISPSLSDSERVQIHARWKKLLKALKTASSGSDSRSG